MMTFKKNILLVMAIFLFCNWSCKKDCNTTGNCSLEPDAGNCEAAIPIYYFDSSDEKCKEFLWGGCDGVVPFETLAECELCECTD